MEPKVRPPPAQCRPVMPPLLVTRRLRSAVEFVLTSLIWGVLVGLATSTHMIYIERAHVAEILVHATTIKQEMTALRAETGRWPGVMNIPIRNEENRKRPAAMVEYEEGAFTFVLGNESASNRVSFRAAVSESSPRAPVLWLCGYVSPPAGYRVTARNRTDIPMLYLPAACRGET